jgi:hypothetical protein
VDLTLAEQMRLRVKQIKSGEYTQGLVQMVVWFSSFDARVLWVRPNKSKPPSPKFPESLLDGRKAK